MSTPMVSQYQALKKKFQDSILFFRLGDFYEMFNEDALTASKLLGITLTARNKGEKKMPMCGIPYHAAESYIAKLTRQGKKVAICEQLSDPKLPGIVKRDVIKVITPGTTFDQNILDQKTNNFVIGLYLKQNYFGLAVADLTTGEFKVTEISGFKDLQDEINRLHPSECVIAPELLENKELKAFLNSLNTYPLPLNTFKTFADPYQSLTSHFRVQSLEGFGIEKLPFGIQAAGLLFNYLKETQKTDLKHITHLTNYSTAEYMLIDEATLRNLELIYNYREGGTTGTLISVLDKTLTSMGGRLLKNWLLSPLTQVEKINKRLGSVEELISHQSLMLDLENLLKKILDIERILGRIGVGSANARDLIGLKESLKVLPELVGKINSLSSPYLKNIRDNIHLFENLVSLIEKTIIDEPPLDLKNGGIIKENYDQKLDELRNISREGKGFISSLQQKEIARTGINSLKVRFNNIFGYFIEVSKANLKNVPADFIRKQTLVNAERFITPELKEYEEKVLGAEEKSKELEYEIFLKVRENIAGEIPGLQKTAHHLAILDVLLNFARLALSNNYVKPLVDNGSEINIIAGRHPVIEKMTFSADFIPNDVFLDDKKQQLILLTGPNMSGKSTYIRQIALITLLAHLGSFVPAKSAHIGIVDRIFTRVGASDNLSRGQSTFMVEMQEAANILNHATEKSLIILDELGRGTSTYDGVSIAWAVTEFLHDKIKAKTVFATHYHELITVAEKLPRAKNYCVAVKEGSEGIVFLHKVLEGGINKSYGIEVAKLAGLPKEITIKALQILKNLEEGIVEKGIKQTLSSPSHRVPEDQLNLFQSLSGYHPALEALKAIDINNLTPLQALEKLNELKKKIG